MKWTFLLVFASIYFNAGAQIHWALKAGGQISSASYKIEGNKLPTKTIAGFNAGVVAKIYFDERAAFVTGLQFSGKGYKVNTMPGDTLKTYRLHYLDIPVMVQIDLSSKRNEGFYCKFGPSVGVGLYGKEIYTGMNGNTIRNKAIMSITGNHFGVFDAAMNVGIGYCITRSFFAEAMYAYGIGNINNDQAGPNIKNRVASLSVGWWLR